MFKAFYMSMQLHEIHEVWLHLLLCGKPWELVHARNFPSSKLQPRFPTWPTSDKLGSPAYPTLQFAFACPGAS